MKTLSADRLIPALDAAVLALALPSGKVWAQQDSSPSAPLAAPASTTPPAARSAA